MSPSRSSDTGLLLPTIKSIQSLASNKREQFQRNSYPEGRLFPIAQNVLQALKTTAVAVERAVVTSQSEHIDWSDVYRIADRLGAFLNDIDDVFYRDGLEVNLRQILDMSSTLLHETDHQFTLGTGLAPPDLDSMDGARDALESAQQRISVAGIELSEYEALKAASSATEALKATRDAAGQTADIRLGHHYQKVAESQGLMAEILRVLAFLLFIVAGIVAWNVGHEVLDDGQEGVTAQLFKFLFTLPFVGLGFWLSHESSCHRTVARRAKEIEVRLYTLEAFMEPMTEEHRTELRAKVGESLLVGPLALGPGAEKGAIDVQALLEKLLQAKS